MIIHEYTINHLYHAQNTQLLHGHVDNIHGSLFLLCAIFSIQMQLIVTCVFWFSLLYKLLYCCTWGITCVLQLYPSTMLLLPNNTFHCLIFIQLQTITFSKHCNCSTKYQLLTIACVRGSCDGTKLALKITKQFHYYKASQLLTILTDTSSKIKMASCQCCFIATIFGLFTICSYVLEIYNCDPICQNPT